MNETPCLACDSSAKKIMNNRILNKYDIDYFQCTDCGCIFTEKPYWLEEAYSEAISFLDTGIMTRNLSICNEVMLLLNKYFTPNSIVVDYGAGYGMLTRMLRDNGVNALWYDTFSKNLLCRGFDYDGKSKADVFLAFEVVEHLPNPAETIGDIMSKTDCFIFSTNLLEQPTYESNKDWWYFVPESGQHVFLSTKKSMEKLAQKFNCNYLYINGLHVFHRHHRMNKGHFLLKIKSYFWKGMNFLINKLLISPKFKSKIWSDNSQLKKEFNKGN